MLSIKEKLIRSANVIYLLTHCKALLDSNRNSAMLIKYYYILY